MIATGNIEDYNNDMAKLDDTDIELNVTLLELDDFENIELTPKHIMDIDWLIKKEEET